MKNFKVPTREEVSPANQVIFDNLKKGIGMVPNIFATLAYSENALGNYLTFQSGKTSLSNKEKEIINLVVSEVNNCNYCKSAHTEMAKMNGFTDEQALEIRAANISFDPKFNALAQLTQSITENHGFADDVTIDNFFAAGYTKENLVDTILRIGEKIITNYLHAVTQVPIDFPTVPELSEA
jgi:uncharacterized peroxidase-related enzyme